MFEPFNPYRVAACKNFRYRQYIRPENDDPNFVEPAKAIVSGRINDAWIDQFNRNMFPNKRLIKEIRANLFLGWLKARFPELRLVLVLRHPCSDALSRTLLGWRIDLDELWAQTDLMADFLAPFAQVMQAAEDDFERHVVLWCIENYVAFGQLSIDDCCIVYYERLCGQPQAETERLFRFLDKPLDTGVFSRLRQPPQLVREDSAIARGGDPIEGWRNHVSLERARRAMNIVHQFGLDAVYGLDSSMPNGEGAARLFGSARAGSRL
jgi:hypothetical protein